MTCVQPTIRPDKLTTFCLLCARGVCDSLSPAFPHSFPLPTLFFLPLYFSQPFAPFFLTHTLLGRKKHVSRRRRNIGEPFADTRARVRPR